MVDKDLGGFDKMRADFVQAGLMQFGSGWAWLAIKNAKLQVTRTPNGENPLMHDASPILGVDVWITSSTGRTSRPCWAGQSRLGAVD
jgi:Fe-Mn family superoxide dismutase